MDRWFTVNRLDEAAFVLSEYRHWEETHCYLLKGSRRSLLIDTGLGIGNIREQVDALTRQPVTAVATHVHWDHIGGHRYFPDFWAHAAELDWLRGQFPLPTEAVRRMVADRCTLPEEFDLQKYEIFQGEPSRLLADGDIIDLGDRRLTVLHTPGHAPGHLCFWEEETGYLFTGDLVYAGVLFADYPSTDPAAYLASLEKIALLPAKKLCPGHHSPDIRPELAVRMRDALRALQAEGRLRHGGGFFDCGDWGIRL